MVNEMRGLWNLFWAPMEFLEAVVLVVVMTGGAFLIFDPRGHQLVRRFVTFPFRYFRR